MGADIGVLVVDGRQQFLDSLRGLLAKRPGVRVIGAACGTAEAVERCRRDAPDVVLLDLDLPEMDGIEATGRLKGICPDAKIIVLTVLQSPSRIAKALAAGACGYLPKTQVGEQVFDAVRRALAGEMVMPASDLPLVLDELLGSNGSNNGDTALSRLTGRETEILQALAEGRSTAEVAAELCISRLTVQSHVKSILAKLGVHSKIEAVTIAWRHGLATTSRSA